MTTLNIVPGASFTVLSSTSIRHADNIYEGVSLITYPDGTTKTCAEIIAEAGGVNYSTNELKRCVKVEGYDPDTDGRGIFTVYSNNSRQTSKNETASVPGRVWCEMFNFLGDADSNQIVKMWDDRGLANNFVDTWIGFKLNWGMIGARSYVLTHTSDFGEESQPTPAVSIDTTYMHKVRLSGLFRSQGPLYSHYYVPIRAFNLYRTTIGTDGAYVYRKVDIDPVSIAYGLNQPIAPGFGVFPHSVFVAYPGNFTYQHGWEFVDDVPDDDLGQITLDTIDWDMPPTTECRGLTAGWNGMLFAHWENTLIPFEPYRPHAAPAKYRIAFPHKINATVVDGNSLIVLTTGPAYMVTGAHPGQLNYEVLQHTQSSKEADLINGVRPPSRGVVRTPFGIAYASDEGISLEAGGRSVNMTDKHYDKISWQNEFRANFGKLRLGYSNEKVVMFMKDAPNERAIMISNETGQLSALSGYAVRNVFSLAGSDGLFVVTGTALGQSSLYRFEDNVAGRVSCYWRSKKFVFAKPGTMGVMQIAGEGVVTAAIYADGAYVASVNFTLSTNLPQQARLPTGVRATEWEIELTLQPNALVRRFYLANTPLELQSG
jgi:hypothetical protein